jgi:ABC-type transport system involved in multi-copper enzyme maturation permease subunit
VTTLGVARHDLGVVWNTTARNGLLAVSVLSGTGGVLAGILLSDGQPTPAFLSFSLWIVTGTTLSAYALLFSAVVISGARESGQLRVLFGTPIDRPQFFLGILLSRSLATVAVSATALTLSLSLVVLTTRSLPTVTLLSRMGYTLVVTLVYAAVGVSISAVSRTRLRALATAVVTYVVFGFWTQFTGSVLGLDTNNLGLLRLIPRLSPFGAYSQLATPAEAIYAVPVESWHLSTPVMVIILLLWVLLPAWTGYASFSQSDIR